MEYQGFTEKRRLKVVQENYDLVVVGGGLTGVCCAITAARTGIKVVLLQDRPVLGGNASSEVRLWALGATSHMGNNNRWAREGGVINEILTENIYRNKEGNPVLFDMVLIDKVMAESNITLYLNTVVYDIEKSSSSHIAKVYAYNPSSESRFEISGTLFADCSGDGIVSYLAGVPYRMGAEEKDRYNEGFAPDKQEYGELLGHSIFFYMRDTGIPVTYVAPDFALEDVEACIPKIRNDEYFNIHHHGCKYWWLEYGGRLDTIYDTEKIKMELWKIVYGIWGYIKNSGKYPEMINYTLEWVGLIPGKRESRRFKGLYTLTQQDIIEQREHYDAVSYGGWAIDLHPADGVYAFGRGCNQWHSKGVYQIPFRCFVGEGIDNLMFGGRIASVTHVANGSTRVMCTAAHAGQAIGMAAGLCIKNNVVPFNYVDKENIKILQRELIESGQYIPGFDLREKVNLLYNAKIQVSSQLLFSGFRADGGYCLLDFSAAVILPVLGQMPEVSIEVLAEEETILEVQLRTSEKKMNYTPDIILETFSLPLSKGKQVVHIPFNTKMNERRYIFICFMANSKVRLAESSELITGLVTVFNQINIAVSNFGRQEPPVDIGVEAFEFWCPKRRPEGKNLAISLSSSLDISSVNNLFTSYTRPVCGTNAWIADWKDTNPSLTLKWDTEQTIHYIRLFFDTDYDHAMETVQMGHITNIMPFCVRSYKLLDESNHILYEKKGNYQSINTIEFQVPVVAKELRLVFEHPLPGGTPASLFHIIVK